MKRWFITGLSTGLFIALTFNNSLGQTSPNEMTDKFFSLYSKDPEKAVDYITATNKWNDNRPDIINSMKNQIKNGFELMGEFWGYELLSDKSTGKSLRTLIYVAKYDRQPIKISFIFYKPTGSWRLLDFLYEPSFAKELEEAARVYPTKENKR